MEVEQQSDGAKLRRLKIKGSAHELRTFALALLDAIDDGKRSMRIGETQVKIRKDGD